MNEHSGEQEPVHIPYRQVLAEALTEHADELAADIMRPDREGIQRHWLDLAPAADMLLEALVEAWFARRRALAERFGVDPSSVPGEVVWYISDAPVTDDDRQRARQLAEQLGLMSPPHFGSSGGPDV